MSVGGLRRCVGHFKTHHLLQRHRQILALPCCLRRLHVRTRDAIRRMCAGEGGRVWEFPRGGSGIRGL